MFHTFQHTRFIAVRAAVPVKEICLDEETQYYGGNTRKVERIRNMTGMDKRRVSQNDSTASDFCAFAAEDLFNDFPDWRKKIDALIFVSQTPDWDFPATACTLQHRLKLPTSCASFDVGQGCAGYVYGLWLASSLIESGATRNVLLLVGESRPHGYDPRNRIIAPVFGDGGSATLLAYQKDGKAMSFELGTDGSGYESIIIPAGRSRIPYSPEAEENAAIFQDINSPDGTPWRLNAPYMDGGAIFSFTLNYIPDLILRMMQQSGFTEKDINWLILHQANRQIMDMLAKKTGFSTEKTPMSSFSKYGNLASASIPGALCDAFGSSPPPGRMLLCGYGVGLSWAACVCEVTDWNCKPVLDYTPPADHQTRAQLIQRWQRRMSGTGSEQ